MYRDTRASERAREIERGRERERERARERERVVPAFSLSPVASDVISWSPVTSSPGGQ